MKRRESDTSRAAVYGHGNLEAHSRAAERPETPIVVAIYAAWFAAKKTSYESMYRLF